MKLKLKLLAAALAVAATATAGVAQARIQDATRGSSEFIFSAWDSNAGRGYTYDLEWGASFTDFVGADTVTNIFPTGAVVMTPTGGRFFDALLPGFDGFLSRVTATDVRWNLAAGDSVYRHRVLTTLGAATGTITNQKVKDMSGKINLYVGAVNGFGSHFGFNTADDGWATTVSGDGTAYAGNVTWDRKLGDTCNFVGCDTTAGLGQSNNLYMFFQKSTSALQTPGGLVQLTWNNKPVFGEVYAAPDGYHLRIAAVPEPSGYALLLAGLGLVGFMARRRLGN